MTSSEAVAKCTTHHGPCPCGEERAERIKAVFMDMLGQGCAEWTEAVLVDDPTSPSGRRCEKAAEFKGYDSCCLSAYEDALDLAVELGWIPAEQVLR